MQLQQLQQLQHPVQRTAHSSVSILYVHEYLLNRFDFPLSRKILNNAWDARRHRDDWED